VFGRADSEHYSKPELKGEDMPRQEQEQDNCSQQVYEMPTVEPLHGVRHRPYSPIEIE
jgi:hypothetical protein